ncbi:MAG TPA: cytochrome c oxidase subunit 3 [Povalibacter sp.]|nr:cytochrome c oxidase subunit 3 [Povalibacter sp.]
MSSHAAHFESDSHRHETAELGMWVFLATELMFFGPLLLGYAVGREMYGQAFAAASRHTDVVIGTINTAVLLTSSLFMALAAAAVRSDRTRMTMRCLLLTAALGVVFLVLKGFEYLSEWQEHLVPWADFRFEPRLRQGAGYFYYLYFAMTGLHALHLTIGIVASIVFALRLRVNSARALASQVGVTGLYWHFVDMIWVFLYPILYLVERHG